MTGSPKSSTSDQGPNGDVHRPAPAHACGCAARADSAIPADGSTRAGDGGGERKAAGVDPSAKCSNLARLSRIEGQVRGLKRMIEEDRYCPDILSQITAVQEALRGVSRELVRNHLRHCVRAAVAAGNREEAEAVFDELADIFHRSGR